MPLERSFGSWRIGSLYVLSGIFGTMVSVVFLPEVLSVGASASVFGLVGTLTAIAPSPNPNPNPNPNSEVSQNADAVETSPEAEGS